MRGWKKTITADADNPIPRDMHLTDGDSSIVEGDEATAQEVGSRLLLFRGSYFLDLNEGLPWYQEILEKGIGDGRIRELIRQAILSHPAIVDVPKVELVRGLERAATLSFEARTTENTIVRSEDHGAVSVGGTTTPRLES